MAYSEVSDLLVGDMPLPRGMNSQKHVDDAADEIDSHIGFIYVTPVDIKTDTTTTKRPVCLLLKRLNNNLASGRLIMAMTASGQRQELHAYGASLVLDAVNTLKMIASGDILLDGALPLPVDPGAEANFTGPQIANVDAESNVEAFYDRISNPNYCFTYPVGGTGLVAGG